ncbi:hepatocyte growth factor isoform X2 [Nelusetta ayraudi]|uniref:hepatocyte growth factor isoform X2 n=1 Tax=Nelusetta ayraudi TaxID=303726 RepID=UPI003F7197FF
MWIYRLFLGLFVISCCECRRNALQDYQKTDGVRLALEPPPDASSYLTKVKKQSLSRCAKACSRNSRIPFTCRAFLYDHKNRKCHWLSYDRNSPGVQSQEDFNYYLYQKKDYVRECIVGTGQNYRGCRSVTVSGIRCQAWASPIPHEHKFMAKRFSNKDLRENYCRNPDNSTVGPWCFTTDPQPHLRHQDCGIPQCSQVECMSCNGEDYRGPMDHTESGKECQRWDLDRPHKHLFHPKRHPDKGLQDNYCRNPDGRHRPWCYTTDPDAPWEYCDIKVCECYEGFGESYQGEQSRTRSNLPCAPWRDHNNSGERGLLVASQEGSYCRNPDKDKHGPWCYTNSSAVPWDYCHVKPCDASQNTIPLGELSSVACFIHKRTRIVGGGPVGGLDGSWMVSIQRGPMHWCGGSLIREEWVLSDRQCFSSCVPDLSEYRVWLGVSDIREGAADLLKKQEVSISQVICGPEGSSLVLLRLAQPARPADNVHTIQLPVAGCSIPEGRLCKMYGWGETKGTGHEDMLKAVDLPIVGNEKCREMHRGNLLITSSKICAGGRRNEGVCERDYGGPLVCQDGDIKVIVGVSVHGRGCARQNQPGIFINVPFYTQWIYKVFRTHPDPQ